MNKRYLLLLLLGFALFPWQAKAYVAPQDTINKETLQRYKDEATQLIKFFGDVLNTVGSKETTAKEKDIIISSSYLKMFKSEKVQIEDDLDENRNMPVNKDVQAYLKDVDFFFQGVTFELDIQDISYSVNEKNEMYFKVTLNRHLKGLTIKGDSVNTNRTRYIEININENDRQLKIVSIYTNKINEKDDWRAWWNALSVDWRLLLGANVNLTDKIKMSFAWSLGTDYAVGSEDTLKLDADRIDNALAQVIYREDLDLSSSKGITDFTPLNKLTKLKRLVLAGSAITDIKPVRNMNNLTYLDLGNTKVSDISALRYSLNMSYLNLNNTLISDLDVLTYLPNVEKLTCNNTNINTLKPLAEAENLVELRCNNTKITNLEGLRGLNKLDTLYCAGTGIADLNLLRSLPKLSKLDVSNTHVTKLDSLVGLSKLKFVFIDNTQVQSLKPLKSLPLIERVFCDNAPIERADINDFMQAQPKAVVIYESALLVEWWKKLPEAWKKVFIAKNPALASNPSKEELHKLTSATELKITANDNIISLDPLRVFTSLKTLTASVLHYLTSIQPLTALKNLTELDISRTMVEDLSPLAELSNLEVLNLTYSSVLKLDPLAKLTKLTNVYVDNTGVVGLFPLANAKNLQLISANDTKIAIDSVENFALVNPGPLVIFRAQDLTNWWSGLNENWKKLFAKIYTLDIANPTSEQLHKLCCSEVIKIDQSLKIGTQDLMLLRKFYKLKDLDIEDQNVSDLTPVAKFRLLENLHAAKNPIKSAQPLKDCKKLKVIDLENTPLENLKGIEGLKQLTTLKISGTKVSDLEELKNATKLQTLECLNAKVGSVKDLMGIKSLKTLKITNNLFLKTIGGLSQFKKDRSDVELIIY